MPQMNVAAEHMESISKLAKALEISKEEALNKIVKTGVSRTNTLVRFAKKPKDGEGHVVKAARSARKEKAKKAKAKKAA